MPCWMQRDVMNLQHERIAQLCEQLEFARLGSEWPALAQDAARNGVSFADFLEKVLASEQWRARSTSVRC